MMCYYLNVHFQDQRFNNVQNLDTAFLSFKPFEDRHLFTFYTRV